MEVTTMRTKIISAIVLCAALCGMLSAQVFNTIQGDAEIPAFEVLVLDAEGNPVPNATVAVARWSKGEHWSGKTDKDGIVKCFNVEYHHADRPILTIYALSPDGKEILSQWFTQHDQKITLRLQPPAKLTGRVIDDESGKPVPNVPISVSVVQHTQVHKELRNGSHNLMTDEQGYFLFDKGFYGEIIFISLQKTISEENPECKITWGNRQPYLMEPSLMEDLCIIFKINGQKWKTITADDRFLEALIMETSIKDLEKRFEEMFRRAKKNGRNVLFYPYPSGAQDFAINNLPGISGTWESDFASFEFVTLHTPRGIGRNSRTFEILKEMTGQEITTDMRMIVFSADGKFLGLLNHEGGLRERLQQFLEEHVPKKP
jgi:5-hydroxyisourate hydrolase-like protein (transthyretin family)